MKWTRARLAVLALVGLVTVGGAGLLAVSAGPAPADAGPGALGVLVVFAGAILALWFLARSPDDGAPAPWSDDGALAEQAPERTPEDVAVSGEALTTAVESAVDQARRGETVEEAMAAVRRPLRSAFFDVYAAGGDDRATGEDALAAATWTDDPVAASVLCEDVTPPEHSLRERIRIWLFPERAVRRRTARAVGALAALADERVPPVVGQHAPRPVPTVAPPLADLQRAVDGTLQRADEVLAPGGVATAEDSAGPATSRSTDADGARRDGDADGARTDEDGHPSVTASSGGSRQRGQGSTAGEQGDGTSDEQRETTWTDVLGEADD